MARQTPKQEWFVYTGERVIPEGVTHVKFAQSVIEVGRNAFDDCRESLKAVVLNEGIQAIGYCAFWDCSLLESILFPSTVISIGHRAFHDCRRLREVVLSEGIQTIGDYAFHGCLSLESITFPSTVISIGDGAFTGCSNLREAVLNEGIQTIGELAFDGCSSLESITFPSTVISIGVRAFYNCRRLREVVMNEGIQTIGYYAFHGCSLLESIRFPSTVVSIGDGAFDDCSSLREVVLNEGIQMIGELAFDGCSSLDIFQFAEISERFVAIQDHISFESQTRIEDKLNAIIGVVMRGGVISISHEAIQNWGASRGPLLHILTLISFHELKEATTIIELALWKVTIGETEAGTDDVKRKDCCVEFPGPAKEAVLKFYS